MGDSWYLITMVSRMHGKNNQHEVEEVKDKQLLDEPYALLVKIKYWARRRSKS